MSKMFTQIDFRGSRDRYSSHKGFQSVEGGNVATQQVQLCGLDGLGEWGNISMSFSDLGCQDDTGHLFLPDDQLEEEVQLFPDYEILDDIDFDLISQPFQSCKRSIKKLPRIHSQKSNIIEAEKENSCSFPLPSLSVLQNYGIRSRRLNGEKIKVLPDDTACSMVGGEKLSTDAILRLAGEKFIQAYSQGVNDLSVLSHPFAGSFLGILEDEIRDVGLIEYLLASAEGVSQQQFDRANKLLNLCGELSSSKGSPVQRLGYYFSEALREKINRETGRITSKGLGKRPIFDINEALRSPSSALFAYHQKVPFSQVSQFTGMQAILENVAEAKKVHIIDLEIRNGTHCTVLMQAFAARHKVPLEHLKITAVGTKSKQKLEDTGMRLMKFAESMNLSFSFNVVVVADMLDLNEDLFELDAEEAIAVCASFTLWPMIAVPHRLERLMQVLRNINPCVIVVAEVEANHNSPVFENRFIEALFFYGTFFDALNDCMDCNDPDRFVSESVFSGEGIWSMVAADGEERTVRHVSINVWRAFFTRFGMAEMDLSMSSLYQARLVLKNFPCGNSCTLEMDDKCLIIEWKGEPVYSLSVWKFHRG